MTSISAGGSSALLSADSEHDASERSTAEVDAPSARQALGCCKHERSHVDVGANTAASGQRQPRERRRPRAPRRQSGSSGTAL